MVITEALAEIKTIGKRLASKRGSLSQYLVRQSKMRDPLEKDGGSAEFIKRERQAIRDLEERLIRLRILIHQANLSTPLMVQGQTRSVQGWLTWRREVAQGQREHLGQIMQMVTNVRQQAATRGLATVSAANSAEAKMDDVVVNIDESEVIKQREEIELILGELDGQLSMHNATTQLTEA